MKLIKDYYSKIILAFCCLIVMTLPMYGQPTIKSKPKGNSSDKLCALSKGKQVRFWATIDKSESIELLNVSTGNKMINVNILSMVESVSKMEIVYQYILTFEDPILKPTVLRLGFDWIANIDEPHSEYIELDIRVSSCKFTDESLPEFTSKKSLSQMESVLLYPNPVIEELTLELMKENLRKIILYDVTGKRLFSESYNEILPGRKVLKNKLDFGNYSPGVYFLKIETTENTFTKRIVKK